jgi:hypothetical protein
LFFFDAPLLIFLVLNLQRTLMNLCVHWIKLGVGLLIALAEKIGL